jgi:thioredoxin 1
MLYTNLKHIETAADCARIIKENENVMIVCGRMGPFSIPVYRIAEELETEFSQVKFFDLEYDNPESGIIRNMPEVQHLAGFPLTVYFKQGEVVRATVGIQTKEQIINILEHEFADKVIA